MRHRAALLTLSLSLLLAGSTRAQDAGQRAQEAIDEIERLREAGKLRAAEERLRQTRSIPRQEIPAPVMSRLVLAQDALLVAVAAAYTRGEDCGYFSAEERARDPALVDRTPAELGLELFATLLERLDRIKDPAVQTAYLTEPRFAPLRERPLARCIFASTWRRPHREVWPGVRVESGDHAFDVAFDLAAHLALQSGCAGSPRPDPAMVGLGLGEESYRGPMARSAAWSASRPSGPAPRSASFSAAIAWGEASAGPSARSRCATASRTSWCGSSRQRSAARRAASRWWGAWTANRARTTSPRIACS